MDCYTEAQTWLQDCLASEQQEPMLSRLQPLLKSKRLIVSKAAVTQFAKLVLQFGGSKERQRWQALQETLTVFHPDASMQSPTSVTDLQPSVAQFDTPGAPQTAAFPYSAGRVVRLQAISNPQKEVFALGDEHHALTLTANSKACEVAARQGVRLEVSIHRAVWLTGM